MRSNKIINYNKYLGQVFWLFYLNMKGYPQASFSISPAKYVSFDNVQAQELNFNSSYYLLILIFFKFCFYFLTFFHISEKQNKTLGVDYKYSYQQKFIFEVAVVYSMYNDIIFQFFQYELPLDMPRAQEFRLTQTANYLENWSFNKHELFYFLSQAIIVLFCNGLMKVNFFFWHKVVFHQCMSFYRSI